MVVGPDFEVVDNGDSVQAIHGNRVVYLSSLRVGASGSPLPAAKIRAMTLASLEAGERLSHIGHSVLGDAEIRPGGGGWQLSGTMCANGSLATCVVNFHAQSDRAWAISAWRSLLCDTTAA
jgi:hypothetical protein